MANLSSYQWTEFTDSLHLRFFEVGRLTIGTGWNTRDVCSPFWRFYRNNRDGASLELAGETYPLRGKRLYFVPEGVAFHCRNTVTIDHFYVHFDLLGLPRLAARALFDRPVCLNAVPELEELVRGFADAPSNDLAWQCGLKAALYAGLGWHLTHLPPERREHARQCAASLAPFLPALHFIEAHYGEPVTNKSLAGLCCLSEDYFIRRFRDCVGQTPAQYLLSQRIMQAAQQLLFTDKSLEQVAEETGFGSRAYFSRMFARARGISPAAYRKGGR